MSLGGHFAACLDAVRAGMAKHDHHLASFYILKKGTGTDDDPMCYLIPFNRVSMAVSKKLTELWKLDLVKAITASLVEWANDPEIIACSRTGELMVVAVDENGPLWKPTVLGELR